MLSLEQGKDLVKLAKDSIAARLDNKHLVIDDKIKEEFSHDQGCFVSLHLDSRLRGCIGFPEPIIPLWKAIAKAAQSAAFSDPRFSPLSKEEFEKVNIEVSVLTVPKKVEVSSPQEYLKKIKVGRDGLIIRGDYGSGLLLPQVPVELNWDIKEFLENLCMKAGLPENAWKSTDNKIYSFQAQVFAEK